MEWARPLTHPVVGVLADGLNMPRMFEYLPALTAATVSFLENEYCTGNHTVADTADSKQPALPGQPAVQQEAGGRAAATGGAGSLLLCPLPAPAHN